MRLGLVALVLASAGCFYSEPRVFTDDPRAVPDVTTQRVEDAVEDLDAEGFLVRLEAGDVQADPANCPDAQVLSQDPPGGQDVVKASTIVLTVASCP